MQARQAGYSTRHISSLLPVFVNNLFHVSSDTQSRARTPPGVNWSLVEGVTGDEATTVLMVLDTLV